MGREFFMNDVKMLTVLTMCGLSADFGGLWRSFASVVTSIGVCVVEFFLDFAYAFVGIFFIGVAVFVDVFVVEHCNVFGWRYLGEFCFEQCPEVGVMVVFHHMVLPVNIVFPFCEEATVAAYNQVLQAQVVKRICQYSCLARFLDWFAWLGFVFFQWLPQ